jgi:succinoglycan biosynthesis transport protein ExoP
MPLPQPANESTWLWGGSAPALWRGSAPTAPEVVVLQESAYGASEPWFTTPNVLRLLRRRLGLILVCTCVLSLLGVGITLLLPPSYKAEVLIVVDSRREQISNIPDVVSALPPEQAVLRSEIDALGSNALIRSVVRRANLTAIPEFNPTLQLGAPWSWAFWLNENEQKALKRQFAAVMQSMHAFFGIKSDPSEERELEESELVAIAGAIYRKNLTLSTDGRSLTMHVVVKSRDPELAAKLANLHADLYVGQQFRGKSQATESAHSWLKERITPLKADLQRTEAAVQRYREQNELITSAQGMTVTVQQLSEINTQLAAVRAEKAQNQARLAQIRELIRRGSPLDSVPDVLASPLVQALRAQEAQVSRLEADAAARYITAQHPAIISAKAQLRQLQSSVKEEVNKIATSLERAVEITSAKERSLEQELNNLTKRAAAANLAEVKLRELEREAESNRSVYQTFLNRLLETSLGPATKLPDSRIVSNAEVPLKPASPQYSLFFAASIVVAAAASMGLAFLLEGMQERLHSPSQCDELAGVRGLGLVPQVNGFRRSAIANRVVEREGMPRDAVRSILEVLYAARIGDAPRSISITSAVPHEGKTVLAVWLARVSAMAGLKVLLVDADLRRPAVARYLESPQSVGARRGIIEPGKDLQEMVLEDSPTGMHYVTAYAENDRFHGIASLRRLESVLREARESYDLVVVDSAPVLAAPEALPICQMTDGVVLAVRWGHTPYRQVRYAVSMLRPVNANLLGAVVTRADMRRHAQYAFGDLGDVYHRYRGRYST